MQRCEGNSFSVLMSRSKIIGSQEVEVISIDFDREKRGSERIEREKCVPNIFLEEKGKGIRVLGRSSKKKKNMVCILSLLGGLKRIGKENFLLPLAIYYL